MLEPVQYLASRPPPLSRLPSLPKPLYLSIIIYLVVDVLLLLYWNLDLQTPLLPILGYFLLLKKISRERPTTEGQKPLASISTSTSNSHSPFPPKSKPTNFATTKDPPSSLWPTAAS